MRIRKILKWILIWVLCNVAAAAFFFLLRSSRTEENMKKESAQMAEIAGENREITGTDYDRELAVTCDNGTFVGLEKNQVRSYKGIPYAKPPVGELRWKPPVDAQPGSRVYEAFFLENRASRPRRRRSGRLPEIYDNYSAGRSIHDYRNAVSIICCQDRKKVTQV